MKIKIEDNFYNICKKCAQKADSNEIKHSYYYSSQNPYDEWYSRIYNFSIPKEKISNELESLIEKISTNRLPSTLLIKEDELTESFKVELQYNNFTQLIYQTMMKIESSDFDYNNEDFDKIKVIKNIEDLKEWHKLATSIFGDIDFKLLEMFLEDDEIEFISATVDEKIVATTMIFFQDDKAGLHLVGTNPEYRGKGLASLITKFSVNYIKERGYKTTVLQASQMGKSVYAKIGFIGENKIYHWKYNK